MDTNVMLHALARGSAWAPLFRAIGEGRLRLALSTSILLEDEEVAMRQGGPAFAGKLMSFLSLVAKVHGTVEWANPSFQFHLITEDADDNKFTDCAISTSADFLVTSDSHFGPLRDAGYKVQPILPEEFIRLHLPTGF